MLVMGRCMLRAWVKSAKSINVLARTHSRMHNEGMRNQKGFSIFEALLILVIVGLVGLAGWYVLHKVKQDKSSGGPKTSGLNLVAGERVDNQGCSGSGPITFGASPMDPKDVGIILPYGGMVGAHVTPIDHMYFSPIVFNFPR